MLAYAMALPGSADTLPCVFRLRIYLFTDTMPLASAECNSVNPHDRALCCAPAFRSTWTASTSPTPCRRTISARTQARGHANDCLIHAARLVALHFSDGSIWRHVIWTSCCLVQPTFTNPVSDAGTMGFCIVPGSDFNNTQQPNAPRADLNRNFTISESSVHHCAKPLFRCLCGARTHNHAGYHLMCRWNFVSLLQHPEIKNLDYYCRSA